MTFKVTLQTVPGNNNSNIVVTIESLNEDTAWNWARSQYKNYGSNMRVVSVVELTGIEGAL